ncbi:MAG: MBOAT family O-acyltransferase [Chthoniobacteraceae bacterium]
MIFATYWFLVFAAILLPLFWLIAEPRCRLAILIAGSALFALHFAGSAGLLPIAVLGVAVYLAGLSNAKAAHLTAIGLCVLALLGYKYSAFFLESARGYLPPGWHATLAQGLKTLLPATPPLAISFFTFEFVHYLVDRRRGSPAIRGPVDFVSFALFFPSLVAGPIKRYEQFLPSLECALQAVNRRDVMVGLIQAATGFTKKICADNLTLWIERYQVDFTRLPLGQRWLIFAGIGMRILLDFSGYSDIAIGIARMMGVRLPPNFNWPYLARNISDFWRRWHISLSSWIRDYIYIPLGGNRHGEARKTLNGILAFALCGLWHGAAWNFVLWGLFHGLGLVVCNAYPKIPFLGRGLQTIFRWVPPLGWALTLLYVWLGWLTFFYPVQTAWKMAASLFIARFPQ